MNIPSLVREHTRLLWYIGSREKLKNEKERQQRVLLSGDVKSKCHPSEKEYKIQYDNAMKVEGDSSGQAATKLFSSIFKKYRRHWQ